MSLSVSGFVSRAALLPESDHDASRYYLEVDPEYLRAYEIAPGDEIEGRIREVGERRSDPVAELEGTELSLVVLEWDDRLFLDAATFDRLRDWGLVKEGFWLSATLDRASCGGSEPIDLYPKRDVEA